MEPEIQRKIEETVMEVLKHANMDEVTEFKVRLTASERLGIDLSDIEHKRFIRGVVESFLLSTVDGVGEDADANAREENEEVAQEEQEPIMPNKEIDSDGNRVICKLSHKRNVVIQDFRGKSFVSIREFYQKDGKQLPSNKGISLATEQWSAFRKSVPAIEEAIMKLQSKFRADLDGEQNEQVTDSAIASTSHEFVPIEVNRFDGKNYQYWTEQMEFFLKQLKIAYVLTDRCPTVPRTPDANTEEIAQAKAAEQKWLNDNHLCRHNILNRLSDSLYYQYSKKTMSAKELWEELKLVYLYEEFGTRRSQVKKYVEFQMVDEKPIVDQVHELNSIADSIVASGIFIDENFHVSAIISKFPPSWKDFCIKMMREEYLPFWILMDHVRVEEECRNLDKHGEPSNSVSFHHAKNFLGVGEECHNRDKQGEPSNSVYFHHAKNLGPRMRDTRKQGFQWKRSETEIDNKALICYFCSKKGHISKHCRDKKFYKEGNEKHDKENSSAPSVTGVI